MVAIQTIETIETLSDRPSPRPALPVVGAGPRRPRPLPDRATRVRRRRLAVLVVGVALAFGLPGALRLGAGVTSPAPQRNPVPLQTLNGETYVVQRGDTLWTIATRLAPDSDPRPVVDALRSANGGAALEVGDELVLVGVGGPQGGG
jgi:hypothetical protein